MMDMMKIMGKMKEVQAKVKEAQDSLEKITATGESGAGLVKATVNGKKILVSLAIDDDLMKPEDKEMMTDLVIAAVNKAVEEVEVNSKEALKQSTEGLLPNIPGLDLSGLV